jgi:AcrR family transcriptional regulator
MSAEVPQVDFETAALLIAQGELTVGQIAERVGVSRQTIWNWRQDEAFQAVIARHVDELTREVRSFGIGQLHNRMRALQDRHRRCQRIIDERAIDPKMDGVPGGSTGLLVHEVKIVGTGKAAARVDLYSVDVALLAEMRAIEQQASKELGQWVEKREDESKVTVEAGPVPDWFKSTCEPANPQTR